MIKTHVIKVKTQGFTDIIDITREVEQGVDASGVANGIVTVFVAGSTAGITTIEFESGAVSDLQTAIERQAPRDLPYAHDARWGDGNGFSHVRAALMGACLTVPFNDRRLQLGTWQQIILCDFDNRPRDREVLVQIMGE